MVRPRAKNQELLSLEPLHSGGSVDDGSRNARVGRLGRPLADEPLSRHLDVVRRLPSRFPFSCRSLGRARATELRGQQRRQSEGDDQSDRDRSPAFQRLVCCTRLLSSS